MIGEKWVILTHRMRVDLRKITILILVFQGFLASAQNFKVEEFMGRIINDLEMQSFINSLEEEPIESFIPFRKSYKLSFKQNGLELEFNSNLSLSQVNLYDSGYTFGMYKGHLPYDVGWGQDSVSIQDASGVMYAFDNNPFIKYYSDAVKSTQFYFRNGALEHIKLTINPDFVLRNAANIVQSWGLRLLPDGQKVSGDVVDGEGIMLWGERAARYDGEWSYGLPHGVGTYVDSFGNKYAGEFKLGFFWGAGSYYSAFYQYEYDGEFILGKRHGKGEMRYKNGIKYSGDWAQDQMHGIGQYSMGPQYFYQGELAYNNFNGKGVLTTPDGYIKGKFKNGKPNGYCEQYSNQSGQTLSGYWVDGKKEGEFNLNAFGFDRKVHFKNDLEVFPDEEN